MTVERQQAKFADVYRSALRAAGNREDWVYDPNEFSLRSTETVIYLGNVYSEWQKASWWRRGRTLRLYVDALLTSPEQLPATFDDVKARLMPRIRSLGATESLGRQLAEADDGSAERPGQRRAGQTRPSAYLSYRPYNDDLAIELVVDAPASTRSVNAEELASWAIPIDDALRTAQHNLRLGTKGTFSSVAPGVYAATWGDSYDATRLLLTELISRLDLKGDPVALVPDRDHLFITGSDDARGLGAIARLAEPVLSGPRRISGQPFVFRNGAWSRWLPEPGHAHEEDYRRLARLSMCMDYQDQKEDLDARHQRDRVDLHVAHSVLVRSDGSEAVWTVTNWAENATSLLPRTDAIAFVAVGTEGAVVVPWAQVEAILPEVLKPQGLVPERYLVERFPTPAEMKRLAST